MIKKPWSKDIIQHKKLLFKHATRFGSLVRKNLFTPHAQKLPPLEFFEEGKLFNVIIAIPFNEPVAQSDKLNWALFKIERYTLC
jgi:hypothetical protein